MSEREELEAVIDGDVIEAAVDVFTREVAKEEHYDPLHAGITNTVIFEKVFREALLSSGYTKGNGGTGLTDEEKALAFIGDLSDESAGRVLKFVERAFVEAMADKGDALDKIDGHETAVSSTTAAALFLVRHALAVSATSLKIDLGEADIDGEEVGDWVIQIHKGPLPDKGNGELVEAVRECLAYFEVMSVTGSLPDQCRKALSGSEATNGDHHDEG